MTKRTLGWKSFSGNLGLRIEIELAEQPASELNLLAVAVDDLLDRQLQGDLELAIGMFIGPRSAILLAQGDDIDPIVLDPAQVIEQRRRVGQR